MTQLRNRREPSWRRRDRCAIVVARCKNWMPDASRRRRRRDAQEEQSYEAEEEEHPATRATSHHVRLLLVLAATAAEISLQTSPCPLRPSTLSSSLAAAKVSHPDLAARNGTATCEQLRSVSERERGNCVWARGWRARTDGKPAAYACVPKGPPKAWDCSRRSADDCRCCAGKISTVRAHAWLADPSTGALGLSKRTFLFLR